LGKPLGSAGVVFDPGRVGSYFQSPEFVRQSVRLLQRCPQSELRGFHELLSRAAVAGRGLYVTF
jgi:hypothetical protein